MKVVTSIGFINKYKDNNITKYKLIQEDSREVHIHPKQQTVQILLNRR